MFFFLSVFQSRQQLGSSTKVHIALGFLILALLTLLQVKYQNSGNPFQTHGAIMPSFIVLVIGYALTLAGISRPTLNTSYLHIGRRMCGILGTSASGLLVEILLPPWGILILAISALMFAQLLCLTSTDSPMFWTIFPINQSINLFQRQSKHCVAGSKMVSNRYSKQLPKHSTVLQCLLQLPLQEKMFIAMKKTITITLESLQ